VHVNSGMHPIVVACRPIADENALQYLSMSNVHRSGCVSAHVGVGAGVPFSKRIVVESERGRPFRIWIVWIAWIKNFKVINHVHAINNRPAGSVIHGIAQFA
jgi:hypothetical protein